MGIGDWGLGIGDWGLGPIPNFNIDKILFLFNNFNIINKNFKKNEKLFFMLYEISEFKQMY